MTYENWLNENTGFSTRYEKVFSDINTFVKEKSDHDDQWFITSLWLETAYRVGWNNSAEYHKNLIASLKNEIKTQRKEIAGLREERRMLLDKDYPPGYNKQELN